MSEIDDFYLAAMILDDGRDYFQPQGGDKLQVLQF
jgi:hypothetical protein